MPRHNLNTITSPFFSKLTPELRLMVYDQIFIDTTLYVVDTEGPNFNRELEFNTWRFAFLGKVCYGIYQEAWPKFLQQLRLTIGCCGPLSAIPTRITTGIRKLTIEYICWNPSEAQAIYKIFENLPNLQELVLNFDYECNAPPEWEYMFDSSESNFVRRSSKTEADIVWDHSFWDSDACDWLLVDLARYQAEYDFWWDKNEEGCEWTKHILGLALNQDAGGGRQYKIKVSAWQMFREPLALAKVAGRKRNWFLVHFSVDMDNNTLLSRHVCEKDTHTQNCNGCDRLVDSWLDPSDR